MLCFFMIIGCLASWVNAQNGRGPQHLDHNGHGWDIRLAVPGDPGNDYPTLHSIPRTTFSCAGKEPGYYADIETNCQVFRVCTVGSTYGFQSFLCPNGTLFNQAVFVCDWWMNVNCEKSEQFVRNNNEQFENLRLGPQLMKDVKKMLTHPMSNPYNKVAMKSNYIVMQDYKPPAGQLFPNGALLAGPERAPNMIYVPKQNLIQNYINSDTTFSASTPEPIYTTIRPTTFRNTELFQNHQSNNRLQSQNLLTGNSISNGHTRQFSQYKNTNIINTNGNTQLPKQANHQRNVHKSQRLTNPNNPGTIQTNSVQNNHKGQLNRQNSQYTVSKKSTSIKNTLKQSETNYVTNYEKQSNANKTIVTQAPYELAEEIQNEVKQNVVSKFHSISPTITTKTLAYSRVIENPQPGKPKSRITVKTWIVKPTRSAKLIASPSAYAYESLKQPPNDHAINVTTPYVYEKPTSQLQPERIISKPNPTAYTYYRPTVSAKQIITTKNDNNELNLPFTPTPIPSSTPTSTLKSRPILSGRLDVLPKVTSATQKSQLYIETTTSKPSSRLYLPPQNTLSSRQYLSPIIQPPVYYSSNQLSNINTSPSPVFVSDQTGNDPLTTEMTVDSNSNLNFADILTKDKIDNSVNTIVKDTNDILKTASPLDFNQYDQNLNFVSNPEYDPKADSVTDSGESLTSQLPTMDSKSAQIIALPSTKLEPPDESFTIQNTNKLSELPYFKESLLPPANTIERTVSLRITVPEKLAAYLFRNSDEPDYDKLEILNADNSNYLVLSNKMATSKPNFISLGRLVGNKNTNISNSQALVFSLLADSINAAKEYSNIAQQDVLSSTSAPTQFQNINNEELSQITNKISQLTTSHFSGNNNNRNANIVASTQTSSTTQDNLNSQLDSNIQQYMRNQQAATQQASVQQVLPKYSQQLQNNFAPPQHQRQENYYKMNSHQLRNNGVSANLLANNDNQIYSGQLYQYSVPEVTEEIYNRPLSSDLTRPSSTPQNNIPVNLIQSSPNNPTNYIQTTNTPNKNKQSYTFLPQNQNNIGNLINKRPSFEIVKSQSLPFRSAKEQLKSSNEQNSLNQETVTNLLNSDNGISAQLLDKIIGTIPHPLENNKLVTYEKNQSYFFTTKLDKPGAAGNAQINSVTHSNVMGGQNNKPTQNNIPNALTFQFIPSVGYQLDNEKEQQQILSAFRIDEFGAPRDIVKSNFEDNNQDGEPIMTTNVDYSIDHSKSAKQTDGSSTLNALYSGPSSYFAPQASIGSLGTRRETVQNNFNSRLEDLNGNNENGYPKTRPTRQFIF